MSAEDDMWDARANLVLAGAETEEVDAYAHALAEMIRAQISTDPAAEYHEAVFNEVVENMADLIDPKSE